MNKIKILLVDTSTIGHHKSYLSAIIENYEFDFYLCCYHEFEDIADINVKYLKNNINTDDIKFGNYLKWIEEIKKMASRKNIDIIHFLTGDYLYRYFGLGLCKLKKFKIIITCHGFKIDKNKVLEYSVNRISYRRIFSNIKYGVVHTEALFIERKHDKIDNVVHIEYPHFQNFDCLNKETIRKQLEIPINSMVLLSLGATRRNKGLDILLEALNKVEVPFYLLIAGRERDFTQLYIEESVKSYREYTKVILRFLTEKELNDCVVACDIVVLPYRKVFSGASGPLGEGVGAGKIIVGPNHGSLGKIIGDNELGYTFEAENIDSLTSTIEEALTREFYLSEKYLKYQEYLNPCRFSEDYKNLYNKVLEDKKVIEHDVKG